MASATRKPILISGAGLASLLLAQRLLRAAIPFRIFERDASMSFRAQGYRLRLSTEGLDAIESALSSEAWQRFWATCSKTGGGGLKVVDAITAELKSDPQPVEKEKSVNTKKSAQSESLTSRDGKTVGISRGQMRSLFMAGCEPFVHWSHKVTGYRLTSTGVQAIFDDGSKSVEGAMLIAGEGIYSRVAQQLSEGAIKTYDTGARGIHGQAPSTAFKDLGEGVWRLVDETRPDKRVFVITNVRPGDMGDTSVRFGWTMAAQPGVVKAPNDDYSSVGIPAAEIAKSLTAEWHPRLKPLFEEMVEHEAAFWKIT